MTISEFDFEFQPTVDRRLVDDLATLRFMETGRPILFLGQPGCGKTPLATLAVEAGYRGYFTNAEEIVANIAQATREGNLASKLKTYTAPPVPGDRRRRPPTHGPCRCLRVLPSGDPALREAALHHRHHQPGLPDWGEIFGDTAVAAAHGADQCSQTSTDGALTRPIPWSSGSGRNRRRRCSSPPRTSSSCAFAALEDVEAGDHVFGDALWRAAAQVPTPDKRRYLVTEYRNRFHAAGFKYTLTFQLFDEGGHVLHLVFGTSNQTGLVKMKESLWNVDPIAGAHFRDPRDPDQMSLDFGAQLDLSPLKATIIDLLMTAGSIDLQTLLDHALLETMYLGTHVKPAIDQLEQETRVKKIKTGRPYNERVYRLTNDGKRDFAQMGLFG